MATTVSSNLSYSGKRSDLQLCDVFTVLTFADPRVGEFTTEEAVIVV